MNRPLDGIVVLELGSAIAAPFAGRLMADHGARVIKVEPPGGAQLRNRPLEYDTHGSDEFTYRFMPYNVGKESIAVDLQTEDGAEIFGGLVDRADVLLENMRPGTMERLGFGWDTLRERNDGLIYCSITGYGEDEDGPSADRPAMDTAVQAASGWADQIGAGNRPETMDVFAIDHATALYATNGVLLSLIERGRTGNGQFLDVALFDVAVSFLGHHFAEYAAARAAEDTTAEYEGHFAPNGVFETADGYMALFVPPESWADFCGTIDREGFADPDHRFGAVGGRVKHRRKLRQALDEVLSERTTDEWVTSLESAVRGVVCSPVTPVGDVPDDPQVAHRGMVVRREQPDIGAYVVPGNPLGCPPRTDGAEDVPRVGAQTDDLLRSLDFSAADRHALHERGIVAGPD